MPETPRVYVQQPVVASPAALADLHSRGKNPTLSPGTVIYRCEHILRGGAQLPERPCGYIQAGPGKCPYDHTPVPPITLTRLVVLTCDPETIGEYEELLDLVRGKVAKYGLGSLHGDESARVIGRLDRLKTWLHELTLVHPS